MELVELSVGELAAIYAEGEDVLPVEREWMLEKRASLIKAIESGMIQLSSDQEADIEKKIDASVPGYMMDSQKLAYEVSELMKVT